jgi:hypothetical protein
MTALFAGVSSLSSFKELAGACIGMVERKRATPRGNRRDIVASASRVESNDAGRWRRAA